MAKPPPSSPSSHIEQLRSAQAARAFLNRPQAGQKGAPQNRAERRAAARMAGRTAKTATVNSVEQQEQREKAVSAREVVAAIPAAVTQSAASGALSLARGFRSGWLFPLTQLLPVLLVMALLAVLHGLWMGPQSLSPRNALAAHASAIDTGFVLAWLAAASVMSWRTMLPAVAAFGVAAVTATTGAGVAFYNSLFAGFFLTLVWLLGPQVGDITGSAEKSRKAARRGAQA